MTVAFDHLPRYDDLVAMLREVAARRPDLVAIEVIGTSHEGRDILLATITNPATGPHDEKPAFFVEANMHATEVAGSVAALHLVHHLVDGYGNDDAVTRALDTRTFYVVPRTNPDGAELALADDPRYLRSSTRRYPRLEQQPGLMEHDIDGDGRIVSMRIADPNGLWKVHPDDPRLMVPRAIDDDGPGPYYRLAAEGTVHDWNGVDLRPAPDLQGLDLNRNFPVDWLPEGNQRGAGPYPTSEPEVRAIVDAVVARPNIGVYVAYHTFGAVILRPYGGKADSELPTFDLRAYEALGARAHEITGYHAVSVFHGFMYDPKVPIVGASDEWAYEHRGIIGWTTELWSPLAQIGLEDYGYIDWFRQHPVEDDLRLLRWNDEVLGGRGFVEWHEFEHPQLGTVELGGWDWFHVWSNPPPELLEREVAPHSRWAVAHALALPRLQLREVDVARVADGAWRVRAVVENGGWLPTNVTEKAIERKAVRPVELELVLPEGATFASGRATVELGQLAGRSRIVNELPLVGHDDPTIDRSFAEWVVEGPAGTTVEVVARHERAGTARATVTLDAR